MSKVVAVQESNSDYALLPMTDGDLNQVAALEESCQLSLWGREAYAVELARAEAVTLVARQVVAEAVTANLLGFIAARLNVDELHINNIAVRPEWRCRGLGGALLARSLVEGRRLGAKWGVLEVRASNQAAQKLYSVHGFSILGRRHNYYAAPTEDALVMGMSL